jgi:hypothetical protein
MGKEEFDAFAEFCAAQHADFDERDWEQILPGDGALKAAAASYLSKTSWYGHSEQLEKLSERIPAMACADPVRNEQDSGNGTEFRFDVALFSANVRYRIALRRLYRPVANRAR